MNFSINRVVNFELSSNNDSLLYVSCRNYNFAMTYTKEQDLCLIYCVNVSIVKQIISLHFVNCFPHEAQLSCHSLVPVVATTKLQREVVQFLVI